MYQYTLTLPYQCSSRIMDAICDHLGVNKEHYFQRTVFNSDSVVDIYPECNISCIVLHERKLNPRRV